VFGKPWQLQNIKIGEWNLKAKIQSVDFKHVMQRLWRCMLCQQEDSCENKKCTMESALCFQPNIASKLTFMSLENGT
jgi:hypothetical protein